MTVTRMQHFFCNIDVSYRARLFALLTAPLRLALVIVDDGNPCQLIGRVVLVLATLGHPEVSSCVRKQAISNNTNP